MTLLLHFYATRKMAVTLETHAVSSLLMLLTLCLIVFASKRSPNA